MQITSFYREMLNIIQTKQRGKLCISNTTEKRVNKVTKKTVKINLLNRKKKCYR